MSTYARSRRQGIGATSAVPAIQTANSTPEMIAVDKAYNDQLDQNRGGTPPSVTAKYLLIGGVAILAGVILYKKFSKRKKKK